MRHYVPIAKRPLAVSLIKKDNAANQTHEVKRHDVFLHFEFGKPTVTLSLGCAWHSHMTIQCNRALVHHREITGTEFATMIFAAQATK